MDSEPRLPERLVEGRHTPLFDVSTLPDQLAVVHRTTVWATLHVQRGSVRFVELTGEDPRDFRLEAGDSAVITVGVDHRIEPATDATFFVQFYGDPSEPLIGQRTAPAAASGRRGGPWVHRGSDLDSVEEIFEMVTRQYSDVVQDDLLARTSPSNLVTSIGRRTSDPSLTTGSTWYCSPPTTTST